MTAERLAALKARAKDQLIWNKDNRCAIIVQELIGEIERLQGKVDTVLAVNAAALDFYRDKRPWTGAYNG